ncbi:MAG: beta-lactamase family protein [Hyphomicrobium sp.]|nr:beta-lactamase family protein [Hyphomicrobium sp.]
MARIGTTILGAALLLLIPGAALADWSTYKSARVDSLVQRFLKPRAGNAGVPALSVAVGIDGELVLAKGFGQARQDSLASARTVYHIGSLTKQFTAAAVLRLIESGARAPLSQDRLTLDTPMRDIFEDVEKWTAPEEPPITVRSLLTMTSNLPNFTKHPPREADPWGSVAMPKLLAALKQLPPHGWPNTFEYSNTGYFLLARIIEAAVLAGESRHTTARDYVRAMILPRAGLTQTGFVGDYAPGSDVAQPHYRRRPAFAQPHWLDGCGDMASNVLDLFQWNKAMMEGRVASAASTRLMLSDAARVDPLTYYGMGWFVGHDGEWDSYHHSGSVPGYTSYNAILRHERTGSWLSVTLLTNSDGVENLDKLADDIFYVARSE